MINFRICRICNILKDINLFPYHKNYQDKIDTRCANCKREYHINYQKNNINKWDLYKENNREKIAKIAREYRKLNKEIISKKDVERKKIKRNIDFKSALIHRIRSRIGMAYKGKLKPITTEKLIGCTFDEFKIYIENKFINGMSWLNRKEWHIDHIIPICSFNINNLEEAKKAFHYTNCQPLWAIDNLKKGKSINSDMLK